MYILGIETSSDRCDVSVCDVSGEDVRVLSQVHLTEKYCHSARLMPFVEQCLKESALHVKDLSVLAISIGPGSFTGLRIGLATVKALGLACNLPVVSIPTLDVLACGAKAISHDILVLCVARKTEFYAARYIDQELVGDYEVIQSGEVMNHVGQDTVIIGDACRVLQSELPNAPYCGSEFEFPNSVDLCMLAHAKFKRDEIEDLENLVPLYIKSFAGVM